MTVFETDFKYVEDMMDMVMFLTRKLLKRDI